MAKLPNYYKVSVDGLTVKLDPIYEEMAEVVRCKDCKNAYADPCIPGMHFPKLACMKGVNWRSVEPDHFCSYGERRTDV